MGTRAGTLCLCVAVGAAALSVACSHITKLPVSEVPIAQFEATPVGPAAGGSATVTPVIDSTPPPTPPPVTAPAPQVAATAAPTKTAAAATPAPIEPPDPADDKIQQANKLMKSGRRADLLAARKILVGDVGSGNGTPGEARTLRTVCQKLGDKPCVAKASAYIK